MTPQKARCGNEYALSALCANTKNQTTKGLQYYEKSKSKILNICKPNSAVPKKDNTHYGQTGFILEMQGQVNT